MLNTAKLLYILPDVAYVAELLPGKKEHTFTIQAFRQINGEFLNEDEDFIPENIDKLFSKIDPEAYHLVLPDFLFTNTIIEVKETNENKVKQYIKEELLPKLEISKDSHEIETFSLTTYNGATKIQLTALEKSVLDPLVVSANAHKVSIEHISPLTWTIKAVISLEPSISVLQIGSILYVAEHYIGVDQCTFSKADELENVVDTIKTLKGSQPSIQTVYLLTNQLVEEKLKEQVSSTLPIQQLASYKEDDSQMPSYVKQIIESGMKTLDIPDFPVPNFVLPKHPQGEVKAVSKQTNDDTVEEVESPVSISTPSSSKLEEESPSEESDAAEEPLPAPTPVVIPATSVPISPAAMDPLPSATTRPETTEADTLKENQDVAPEPVKITEPAHSFMSSPTDPIQTRVESLDTTEPETAVPVPTGSSVLDDDSTLARLAGKPVTTAQPEEPLNQSDTAVPVSSPRPVIKNKGEGVSLMKMAFVSLSVFALTLAVGLGLGQAFRLFNNNAQDAEVASPVVTPSPNPTLAPVVTQSPTPKASASATTIDKKDFDILIVNATTKAGYAGTTSSKLKTAGYTKVTAKNAVGEYDPGFYLLLSSQDSSVVEQLREDSGLDLEYDNSKTTEDPSNRYDAVIVLAE